LPANVLKDLSDEPIKRSGDIDPDIPDSNARWPLGARDAAKLNDVATAIIETN
jgi:hypothetical protein